MSHIKLFDEIEFDLEEAKNCIDVYSQSTGISSFVIDDSGKTVYHALEGQCHKFCNMVQNCSQNLYKCSNVHLYGSYQAERFGGKYIFFCPMGLTHWVSPINCCGFMKGALLGGPVLMIEPEDFLLEEIIEQNIFDDENAEKVKRYIGQIPVIKPEVVTSLSELLFINACYIMGNRPLQYVKASNYHLQQSAISAYIHHMKIENQNEYSIKSYPIEKENELLSCVSIGDKSGAQKVLNEILGYIFFSTGSDFEVIKYRTLELVVLLSRAAMEGGAEQEEVFGLNNHYINQIYHLDTLEELSFWLSKILTRFTDCVFNLKNVKNKDIIYKAIEFINHKYMDKLSLEAVADYVHLSPSYFSKLFKDETGYNFSTYLNNVRVEKSKKLLVNEGISLVDISNLVGFEDQSYFTKVFKRITGTTPGKFREARGQ